MNRLGEYQVIVDKMDRRKMKLSGISIYKMNPNSAPTRIFAPEGELVPDADGSLTIQLLGGAVHQPNATLESEYTITKFNKFALRIPARMDQEQRVQTPREMDYAALRAKIRETSMAHADPSPWITERDLRIAIAFAPLAFIVLGIGLGLLFRRGSKSISIGISIVVILLYYGLSMLTISLASQGFLSPLLLTWTPNLCALAAGAWIWRKLATQ